MHYVGDVSRGKDERAAGMTEPPRSRSILCGPPRHGGRTHLLRVSERQTTRIPLLIYGTEACSPFQNQNRGEVLDPGLIAADFPILCFTVP